MKNKKILVVASGNQHKIKEIAQILSDFKVVGCSNLGFNQEIDENGSTFYENALIKAKTVSEALDVAVLSDDSGICVEAFDGKPGIHSARYAGDGDDRHNLELLLKNMQNVENRKAWFESCIVYYYKGKIVTATGITEGEIMYSAKGENGFGYDPIFFNYDLNKCFGECTAQEKNSVSHRYRALVKIKELLKKEGII